MIKALIRIIRWTGPYKKRLALGCVCSFFMTWATAAPVLLAAWLLSRVAEDARGIRELDPLWVWWSLAAILACVAARFAFSYGKNRLQESIGYEVAPDDRIKIGNVLKRVPLGYFSNVKTGDILATATTELGMLELQGMKMVDAVVNGYVNLAAVICFLFALEPLAGAAAIAGTAVSCLALTSVNRVSARLTPASHEATEELAGNIVEYVRGLGTAKSYGHGGAAMKPILATVERLKRARIAIEFGFTPRNVVHLCALKLASVGVVAAAVWGHACGSVDLWVLLALCAFSFTVFSGVERVNDSAHMLGDLNDVMDRVESIEKARPIDADGRDALLADHGIELRDVSFSYDQEGGKKALEHVSCVIPEKTTCAIVGPSGSGKTTIANLMMRFWDVDEGSVLVGGRDVRELTCDSLLRNFSAVFQKVYLFNDTIENNIRFGCPGATREQVAEAARRARVDEFVRRDALRRAEAAHLHRPRAAQGRPDRDPRRGDGEHRPGERVPHTGGPLRAHAGEDGCRHRAQARDHRACRSDPRRRWRQGRAARHARGAARAGGDVPPLRRDPQPRGGLAHRRGACRRSP